MELYFKELLCSKNFSLLFIVIIFDLFFGILRAIKEREINSCIGIDGMIRKTGMIFSTVFLYIIDKITEFNFIGFIPEDIISELNLKAIGLGSLFAVLFIIFESLSILKNMYRCGLPIPAKFRNFLEKLLTEFTNETEKKEGE